MPQAAAGLNPYFQPGVFAQRSVLFALLWWALSGEHATSWYVGVPAALLAAWLSQRWWPSLAWRWRYLPALLAFFFLHSWRGAVDVARRALLPGRPLQPELITYPLRLSAPAAQMILANLVNLMPGSLVVEWRQHELLLHVIDATVPILNEVRELERRIGRLVGDRALEVG